MFDFIWNIFTTNDTEKTRKLKIVQNMLRMYIHKRRFIRMRNAAIEIQSAYRFYKTKNAVKRRLKNDGELIMEQQFQLKKKWLLKLRGDLFKYITFIDKRILEC